MTDLFTLLTLALAVLGFGLAGGLIVWLRQSGGQAPAHSEANAPTEARSLLNWFESGEWRTWKPRWPEPPALKVKQSPQAPTFTAEAEVQEAETAVVATPPPAIEVLEAPVTGAPDEPVKIHLEVPPGVAVRVTVETKAPGEAAFGKPRVIVAGEVLEFGSATTRPSASALYLPELLAPLLPLWQWLTRVITLEMALLLGALAIYAFTRLYALQDYPIYFFTDEAVHTVRAAELIRNGLRDPVTDEFLPTFLSNENYDLSFSVYAQIIPYWLFGYSQTVTRGVSVLMTILGALAVGLTLRRVFNLHYGWVGILLLTITPAWFLHSRTAFETAMMTALYACFLYGYLRYRTGSPRWLYAALVAGALAFYTYTPGQLVVVLTGVLLLISDWRYHWRPENRTTVMWGAGLLLLLALPYVRFQMEHPNAGYAELRTRGAAWLKPELDLGQRLFLLLGQYLQGLNPAYWYLENGTDLMRHRMLGYSHLGGWALPLMGVGLWRVVRNIRQGEYRALLLALLAAPAGAALAQVSVTRALPFIVPATLIAGLGLSYLLERLEKFNLRRAWITSASLLVLGGFSLWMLRDAVVNGPTWFTNYSMFGMQYGARQLFGEAVPRYLTANPTARLYVSPNWANGTNMLAQFFYPKADPARFRIESLAYFTDRPKFEELTPDTTLVLLPEEYAAALQEPKFADIQIVDVLPYPNTAPGFYFLKMRYSDQAAAIFEAEAEARRQPVTDNVLIDGEPVTLIHSRTDFGNVQNWFDKDPFTLARGQEANPFLIDLQFATPRPVSKVTLTTGTMASFVVIVEVFSAAEPEPAVYAQRFTNLPPDPTVEILLEGAPAEVTRVAISIKDEGAADPVHIHVREVTLSR